MKKILLMIAFLSCLSSVIAQENNKMVNEDFKKSLLHRSVNGFGIDIPSYLNERTNKLGKTFIDSTEKKFIGVNIGDLRNDDPQLYETLERVFSTKDGWVELGLSLAWQSKFQKLERMQKIEKVEDIIFIYKGITGAKGDGFIYTADFFDRQTKKYNRTIFSLSFDDYILSDDQFDYIISTIKKE